MDTPYRTTFWLANLGFLGITVWAYQLKLRLARLAERHAARGEDVAGARVEAVRYQTER